MIGPPDLRGLWAFPLTPFDAADAVDQGVFRSGVRSLIDGGADVLVTCGTLGQGDRMVASERIECLRTASSEVGGAIPVLGVLMADGDPVDEAVAMREAGADGALLLPASPDPGDVAQAIASISGATKGRLPIVLYQREPLRLDPSALSSLAALPALVGLKDALGDIRRFRRLHAALGARLAWVGASEDLAVAYLTHGADAVAPASMAYAPGYARTWAHALEAGDVPEAIRLLHKFAWPLTDLRYSRPDIDITVVRDMARLRGSPSGELRAPARPLRKAESQELLRLAGVLVAELDKGTSAQPEIAPGTRDGAEPQAGSVGTRATG